MFDASLVHGAMFWKASLHGLKRRRGVEGGTASPICKHNVLMTGSARVHMGSVFAGQTIPEAILHSIKKNEDAPPELETDCLYGEF